MSDSPRLNALTYVGFQVNSAIDSGHAAEFSFDEVYTGLDRGTLLEDLSRKIPGEFEFSLFDTPPYSSDRVGLMSVLGDAAGAYRGRERRKGGLENSGLCLLLTVILEAIQRKTWV